MSNKSQVVVFRGKASFAKILGDPVLNYSKDGKEWKMDLQITSDTVKEAKKLGISDRVKTKEEYLDGAPHLSFKQRELRKDGKPNDPIKVVDIAGKKWDDSKLIGNGSDVDVKFTIVDYGAGKKKGVYIRSVRVLKLVPYEREEFAPVDEDDEFYTEAQATADEMAEAASAPDDDLDDDVDDVL